MERSGSVCPFNSNKRFWVHDNATTEHHTENAKGKALNATPEAVWLLVKPFHQQDKNLSSLCKTGVVRDCG